MHLPEVALPQALLPVLLVVRDDTPCNCLRNKRFALDQPEQTGDDGDQYLLRVVHHSLHRLEFKLTAKGMRCQKLVQDKCSGKQIRARLRAAASSLAARAFIAGATTPAQRRRRL